MSRIDSALETWEGRAPAGPARRALGLDAYLREAPDSTDRHQPLVSTEAPTILDSRPVTSPRASVPKIDLDIDARLVSGSAGSVPLEQYRRLAAALHDLQIEQSLKTLMLTSASPHEGKTLTTINLALTLSELYARRVLIIDADLRCPSVHQVLRLPNDVGLSQALNAEGLELPIREVSSGLSVLTAGRTSRTPLAVLTSARMGTLIEQCVQQFDWVLLDTPPVGMLPDAQLLTRLIRAVVLVIHAGVTPAATVERAVAHLGADSIIGTVLNRVASHRIPGSDYYEHYGADDSHE